VSTSDVLTVGEWIARLDPRPPAGLHARLSDLLAHAAGRPVDEVADVCMDTGVALLDRMLASSATGRDDALDLLAVDSLVTYAFQAAADRPSQIEVRAAAAMARIAALPSPERE
jgi:hypothetical protein